MGRIIIGIGHNETAFKAVCGKCNKSKAVPYYEVTESERCIYYCEPCGVELTEKKEHKHHNEK